MKVDEPTCHPRYPDTALGPYFPPSKPRDHGTQIPRYQGRAALLKVDEAPRPRFLLEVDAAREPHLFEKVDETGKPPRAIAVS